MRHGLAAQAPLPTGTAQGGTEDHDVLCAASIDANDLPIGRPMYALTRRCRREAQPWALHRIFVDEPNVTAFCKPVTRVQLRCGMKPIYGRRLFS